MLKFEIKKVFSKARNRVALLALFIILVVVSVLTINRVEYVDENGNHSTGIAAAQKLRAEKNQWAGYLTEDVFRSVYRERKAINSEMAGDSIEEENKAYHHIQATESIADLINSANSPWREYDYFAVENITEDEAAKVYEKRISGLEEWMNSGEEEFTDAEKEFLTDQYESLDTPFYYEDFDGWNVLLQNLPTFLMILALFVGFFVSGIFSDEFQTKADAVFFSAKLGRSRAIWSKIGAGFLISTAFYVVFVALHTAIVLLVLGAGGGECPVQFLFWRSCYNITIFDAYLLIVAGGYVGTLFASAAAMLISVLTRSTVIAIIVPFVILCFFPFLSRIIPLPQVCAFFPDRLMDIYNEIRDFALVNVGGKITTISRVIVPVYGAAAVVLLPVVYGLFRKAEIK